MEVFVVSEKQHKTWQLSALSIWMLSLSSLLLAVAGGYAAGARQGLATPKLADVPPSITQQIKADISAQREQLAQMRTAVTENNRVAAQRMAELTARLVRVDAAGARVVSRAKLDPREFNFGEQVSFGGPTEPVAAVKPANGASVNADPVLAKLELFETVLDDRERQLRVLEDLLQAGSNNSAELAVKQNAGQPIKRNANWPIIGGYISSLFGYRTDPFNGNLAFHKGMDFAAREGSNVYAVADGTVTWAGERSGYGYLVEINHGNGYSTRYGHNSEVEVKVGDIVHKNQIISLVGNTGRSTGPHLHFEVLVNGTQVNPAQFLNAKM